MNRSLEDDGHFAQGFVFAHHFDAIGVKDDFGDLTGHLHFFVALIDPLLAVHLLATLAGENKVGGKGLHHYCIKALCVSLLVKCDVLIKNLLPI